MKNLWIPNIFIYNLKSFRTIDVLSKLAGLWIDAKKRIYYSQATHITFICKAFTCLWNKNDVFKIAQELGMLHFALIDTQQ